MIDFYFSPTPNGWKASIALEELVEAGALSRDAFEVRTIDIFGRESG